METRTDPGGKIARESRERAEEVRERAGEMRERAEARVEEQKHSVAREVRGIVTALRAAADKLDDQEQQPASNYAHRAADFVERFGTTLDRKSVGELMGDLERSTREQPGMALGLAAAAGFLGARFMRTTSRGAEERHAEERPLSERIEEPTEEPITTAREPYLPTGV